jgi:3-oxoacyl-[acyl-carrier protein] reductase
MKIDLTGKTAVVTGGAGQLGRTMCRTLAECGANIAVCYLNSKDMAERIADEIVSKYHVGAIAVCCDVTNLESILTMKKTVNEKLGEVEIIVNNAVVQYSWVSVLEQDPKDYQSQFDSCVMHNVYMAKAFVPDMMKNNYGRIVGINTECSMQNFITQSAYVAGKRGMDGVMRVLAKEVGANGITVNQVAPGWTIGDKYRDATDGSEMKKYQDFPYIKTVPLNRRGTDFEIANVVAFLASDLASFITGAFIPVCGGNVMPAI